MEMEICYMQGIYRKYGDTMHITNNFPSFMCLLSKKWKIHTFRFFILLFFRPLKD